MPADDLNFRIHNSFAGQIGQDLMPEKVRVDPLGDASLFCVLLHDHPNRTRCELRHPVRFEQIDSCPSQEFGSARNHWQKVSNHIFATNFVARYL
jgi:hypothetical protein